MILCQLLLCKEVNQLYVQKSPLYLEPTSHPLSQPSRSSQSAKLSSLCYRAAAHELAMLHMVMYICQHHSPNLLHPPLPTLCPHVHPADRFLCTLFLDFTHAHTHTHTHTHTHSIFVCLLEYCSREKESNDVVIGGENGDKNEHCCFILQER